MAGKFPPGILALALMALAGSRIVPIVSGGTIAGTVRVPGVKDSRDAVVYIAEMSGSHSPPSEIPVMDQKGLTFIPHVLPIVAGTTVRFHNSDDVRHNIFTPSPAGDKFNLGTYPKGESRAKTFKKPGEVVCLCSVHSEMSAYILVLQNPHFAVTGKDGAYRLADIPAGKYKLKTWHEKTKRSSDRDVEVPAEGRIAVDFELRR